MVVSIATGDVAENADYPGRRAQHIYDAFDSQKWFIDHRLNDLTGMLAYLEDRASITNELYDKLAFPKIMVKNPYEDWSVARHQICDFLDLAKRVIGTW